MKTKAIATLRIICIMGCFYSLQWAKQTSAEPRTPVKSKKKDTVKQMNLLDERTKMFGQLFELAGAGEDKPVGEATDYLDLLEKTDLPKRAKRNVLRAIQDIRPQPRS